MSSALRRTIRGRFKKSLLLSLSRSRCLFFFSLSRVLVVFFFFFFWWWWRPDKWLMWFMCLIFSRFPDPLFLSLRFPSVERERANLCILSVRTRVVVGSVRVSFWYLGIVRTREHWLYRTLFTDALFLWWTNNTQMSPHEQRRKKEQTHQKYREGRRPPSRLFLPRRTRKWTRIKSATPRTSNGTKVPWMCKLGRKLWARKDASCGLPVCPAPGRAPWRIRSSTSCLKEGTKSSLWTGITSDTD